MITINIYKSRGEWAYAMFNDEGFDHSETIGIDDEATTAEAEAEMQSRFPDARINRVDDLNV